MPAAGPLRPRPHRAAVAALGLAAALATAALWPSAPAEARREAAPAGSVALCGIGDTCRTIGCHFTYPFGSPTLTWDLVRADDSPLPEYWIPGTPLDMKLTAQDSEAWFLGFQLAAVLDCPFPLNAGSFDLLEPDRTTVVSDDFEVSYLTHSCTCLDLYECCGFVPEITGSGQFAWTFRWTPPPRGSGPVAFHLAFNTANGDGTPDFDRISIEEILVEEEPCPPWIEDLRVRKAECDPAQPGVAQVELYREGGGALDIIRETDDPAALGLEPIAWAEAAGPCRPLADGRTLVAWSVAPRCDLGGEGLH